jgi:uncharacterized protein YukE
MTVIDFNIKDMEVFLRDLDSAGGRLQEAAATVEQAVKKVEPRWKGDTQQAFLRFYGDWRKGIHVHAVALKKTAEGLRRMVEEQQS